MSLLTYAINGELRDWTVHHHTADGDLNTDTVRLLTLTIHEPDCSLAQRSDGEPYRDPAFVGSLSELAAHGLTMPTETSQTVWTGCKVCGTIDRPNEFWMNHAKAQQGIETAAVIRQHHEGVR